MDDVIIKDKLIGKTIAVVGNGFTATDSGEEIDAHDVVIRFNRVELGGRENNIGNKTTFQVVAKFSIFEQNLLKPACNDIVCFFHKEKKTKKGYNTYLMETSHYLQGFKLLGCKPTSGFMLLRFLFLWKLKTDVYNFDFYKTNKKSLFLKHNPDKEKEYWQNHPWFNFK